MTTAEMSNKFDLLYNNVMSNQAPGLDEYEKSEFLTKAQDELVKAYFSARSNKVQEGIDDSEKRQMDFSMLISTKNISVTGNTTSSSVVNMFGTNSGVYELNTNTTTDRIMMILNETVKITNDGKSRYLTVVPIKYTELSTLLSKPYKRPIKNQAWRIFNSSSTTGSNIDIVAHPQDTGALDYTMRYIRRPKAIRTATFDADVTIDGSNVEQACELDPIMHEEIVQRAVELAKASYGGNLGDMVSLGVNSGTDKGILTQSR